MFLSNRAAVLSALGLILSLQLTGCSKDKAQDESTSPQISHADDNVQGDSDAGKAMGLQTVHFGFDSYTLNAEAKTVLDANAQVLKDHASVKVQIEGHCDEKGGIQYNLALGEKRANAARKYMMDKGVSGDRVTTISFGKEKPLNAGHDEAAWAQNRRGNFVITAK